MNQQCWCWGCDIRYPAGNLLLRHGATRLRPIEPRSGRSTAYHLQLDGGGGMVLWGFGLAIAPARGLAVLLLRYDPLPRLIHEVVALRTVWAPSDLPPYETTDSAPAWWSALAAFRWIASYERWVIEAAGPDWRRHCATSFSASVVPGEHLMATWAGIGDRLEQAILSAAGAPREVWTAAGHR
jgi:hypothetical protein